VSKPTKNDILTFFGGQGGANDVDKNASEKVLVQTVNFLRINPHTNVTVINVTHRFDVDGKSCINEELRRYNRKLSKIINKFENALLINAVSDTHLFNNHGLHMNVKGKEIMTSKLMGVTLKIFDKCTLNKLIPLMWKNNSTSQIDTLQENKTLQVETINVNLINNCEESKDSGPDCNENKCRLSK
jgi:hypothetical protein